MSTTDRNSDPNGHYPYKLDHVLDLIDQNPPAGPEGEGDSRAMLRDFISPAIAEASHQYIEAQANHVADPTDPELKAIYVDRRADLVEARKRHRANRGDGPNVVAVRGAE